MTASSRADVDEIARRDQLAGAESVPLCFVPPEAGYKGP